MELLTYLVVLRLLLDKTRYRLGRLSNILVMRFFVLQRCLIRYSSKIGRFEMEWIWVRGMYLTHLLLIIILDTTLP